MKVVRTTTTSSETSATIDLFEGRKLPRRVKDRVKDEVGQFLVEQTIIRLNDSQSPLSGYSIPALTSPEYKKKKKTEVGNTRADIQLSGETLDALDYKPTSEGIKIGVFGNRAPVADGHNNLSGDSSLPLRRFIPDEGDQYKGSISQEIDRIISDAIAEESPINSNDLIGITSKSALYGLLSSTLGITSRSEIKLAVFRNPDLLDLLDEVDLLDLL